MMLVLSSYSFILASCLHDNENFDAKNQEKPVHMVDKVGCLFQIFKLSIKDKPRTEDNEKENVFIFSFSEPHPLTISSSQIELCSFCYFAW